MLRIRPVPLALLFAFGFASSSSGQTGGFPIVTGPAPRSLLSAEANGAGGVTIVHVEDHRLFRTVVDADGSIHPTWPGGILLETGPWIPPCLGCPTDSSFVPSVHAGLADDLYLGWVDDSLRVQRVLISAGAIAPEWPVRGRALCPQTQFARLGRPHLGVDGANILRVWFAIGYDIGGTAASAAVRADGTIEQGCTVTSCDQQGLYLASVVESGGQTVAGTWTYGIDTNETESAIASWLPAAVSHRPGETATGSCVSIGQRDGTPTLAPSADGDVIMAYVHDTLGLLAQRLSPAATSYSGGEVWPSPGVALGDIPGQCLTGASDGAGGAFFAFQKLTFAPQLRTTRLQAVTSGGAVPPGWPANGLVVEQSLDSGDFFAAVVDDDSRGAIITWLHSSGSYPYDTSVHAHHVLANGSFDPNWTSDGIDVATAPKPKGHPQLAKDGAGGAWFVWVDGRSDRPDIYAEHVTHDGQIAPPVGVPPLGTPATLALSRGFPNPTRRQVTFTLSLPEDGHVLARVLDVAGRVVARVANEPMTAGAHPLTWNGNGEDGIAAPAGIYMFEIRSGGRVTSSRVVRM